MEVPTTSYSRPESTFPNALLSSSAMASSVVLVATQLAILMSVQFAPEGEVRLALWVRNPIFQIPRLIMKDRLFNRKSKKSHKSLQRHIAHGIPANTAVGPLGFRVELDIGPKGE